MEYITFQHQKSKCRDMMDLDQKFAAVNEDALSPE
jgi:hypothetical protein